MAKVGPKFGPKFGSLGGFQATFGAKFGVKRGAVVRMFATSRLIMFQVWGKTWVMLAQCLGTTPPTHTQM